MGPTKYLNIFECPRIDQTNILIYLDAQELIKWIYWDRGKATNTNTNNICGSFYLNIWIFKLITDPVRPGLFYIHLCDWPRSKIQWFFFGCLPLRMTWHHYSQTVRVRDLRFQDYRVVFLSGTPLISYF